MDARIQRLADVQAIRDTLCRYWRGIDRRDTALVQSTYHPGAYDDHGYYKGPVEGFVESLEPDVWDHFDNTQHFSGHVAVELDPADSDHAWAESYAEAHHLRTDEQGVQTDRAYGLRYVDRFARRDGAWRIAHRICTWDWSRLDPCGGIPLPESYFRGVHSKADPVYAHPIGAGRPASVAELVAKQACQDTLARYARGVDRCDPELVRSTYHEDAYDDHGGYQGNAGGFVDWVKPSVMDAFSCTMHKLGNCLVEVEVEVEGGSKGGRAFAETYAIAHHVKAEGERSSDLIMGVRYVDRLEDRGDGWKIAHRRMAFEWERSLTIGSQQAYAGFARGRRDGSDPVLKDRLAGSRSSVGVPADIGRVADRAEIHDVLTRYCRGVDRRDPEMIRSAYHPDAFDDHGVYKGDLDGFIEFVEQEVHARFRTTMHKLGQILIEIDGDEASSETYAICHHVSAADGRDVSDSVMGIRYLDRFLRRDGAWRIARRELRWEWIRNDALLPLDPEWTLGVAGPGDPALRRDVVAP